MKKAFILLLFIAMVFIPTASAYTFVSSSTHVGWVFDEELEEWVRTSYGYTAKLIYTDESNYTYYFINDDMTYETPYTIRIVIVHNGTMTFIEGSTTITHWGNVSGIYTSGTKTFIYTNFSTYTYIVGGGYTIVGHPYPLTTIINGSTTKVTNVLSYTFTYISDTRITVIFGTTSVLWDYDYVLTSEEDGVKFTLSNYIEYHTEINYDEHTLLMDPRGIYHTYYAYWFFGGETNIHVFTNLYYYMHYDADREHFTKQLDAESTTLHTVFYALHSGQTNTSSTLTTTTLVVNNSSIGVIFAYVSTHAYYDVDTLYERPHYTTYSYYIYGYGFSGAFTVSNITSSIVTIVDGTVHPRDSTITTSTTLTGTTTENITTVIRDVTTTVHYDPNVTRKSTSYESVITVLTTTRQPKLTYISTKIISSETIPILSTSYRTTTTISLYDRPQDVPSTLTITLVPATVFGDKTLHLRRQTVYATLYSSDIVEAENEYGDIEIFFAGSYSYSIPTYYSSTTVVYTYEVITETDLRTTLHTTTRTTIKVHIMMPYTPTYTAITTTGKTTVTAKTDTTNWVLLPAVTTTKTSVTTVYTTTNTTKVTTRVITRTQTILASSTKVTTKITTATLTTTETKTSLYTTTSVPTSTSTTTSSWSILPPMHVTITTLPFTQTYVVIYTYETIITKTSIITTTSLITVVEHTIYTRKAITTLYETTIYIETTTTITSSSTTNFTVTTTVFETTTTIYTNYSSTRVVEHTNTISNSTITTVILGSSPTYTKMYITTYGTTLQVFRTVTAYVPTTTITLTTTISTTITSSTIISSASAATVTTTIARTTTVTFTQSGSRETTLYSTRTITSVRTTTAVNVSSTVMTSTSFTATVTDRTTPGVTTTVNRTVYATWYTFITTVYNVGTLYSVTTEKTVIVYMTLYTTGSTPMHASGSSNLLTNVSPVAPESVKGVTAKLATVTFYLGTTALAGALLYFVGNAALTGNWGIWKRKIILTIIGILVIVLLPRILDWIGKG